MISVIIPVYCVEQYLDQCISSVVSQTFANLEIILVDDGSPDRCGQICDDWALKDARISVIHKKNGGLSDARNCGIDASKGEYICFIDSDDYLDPYMLEQLYTAATKEHAQIAVCNYINEYEDPADSSLYKNKESYQLQTNKTVSGKEFITWMKTEKYAFCVIMCNKLYRRELFQNLRFPTGKVHEDEFIFHRLIYPCSKIACISYAGYHYRRRNSSIMGYGGNPLHLLEASLDRCYYFISKQDYELSAFFEPNLVWAIGKGALKEQNKTTKDLRKQCFRLEYQLYSIHAIKFPTFFNHSVRCFLPWSILSFLKAVKKHILCPEFQIRR